MVWFGNKTAKSGIFELLPAPSAILSSFCPFSTLLAAPSVERPAPSAGSWLKTKI
jgi:hypothetical protein